MDKLDWKIIDKALEDAPVWISQLPLSHRIIATYGKDSRTVAGYSTERVLEEVAQKLREEWAGNG